MFCFRQTNTSVLKDYISDFEAMLRNINDKIIHHRDIPTLMAEIVKRKYDLAPPVMEEQDVK